MTMEEIASSGGTSTEPASESQRGTKRRFKAMIVGGVILIVIGIALAVYTAAYEDEPFLIALGPAFIGVMIVIAAVFGKRL